MKFLTLLFLVINTLLMSSFATARTTTIDALVVYSNEVKNNYGVSQIYRMINNDISKTNFAFRQSGLNVKVRKVKTVNLNVQKSQISTTLISSMHNKTIKSLRERYNADIVLIYIEKNQRAGAAGTRIQRTYNYQSKPYAVMSLGERYATIHEIGHLLGLGHLKRYSYSKKALKGIYGYSYGHGVRNSFVTIMAYRSNFNTSKKIQRFSSPDSNYKLCNGVSCGNAKTANAVRTIKQTAPLLANLR